MGKEDPLKTWHVILVNYNEWQATVACWRRLLVQEGLTPVVWVVENGSGNDSWEKLVRASQSWPGTVRLAEALIEDSPLEASLHLIRSDRNLGFAGGVNLALRQIQSLDSWDWVWLLNNDTEPQADALLQLAEFAQNYPAKLLSPCLIQGSLNNPGPIQALGSKISPWKGSSEHILDEQRLGEIQYLVGAALAIHRQVLEKVGPLPEDCFLYFEDTEYCFRAREQGFELAVVPASKVYHAVSLSVPSRVKLYYFNRNLLDFFARRYPWALPMALGFVVFVRLIPAWRKANADAVWRGILDFVKGRRGPAGQDLRL